MNYEDKIREILTDISNNELGHIALVSPEAYATYSILKDLEKNGLIKNYSPTITPDSYLSDSCVLTIKGWEFLNNKSISNKSNMNITITDSQGFNIGDNNIVNYSSISDIETYVQQNIVDPEDRDEANELVKTLRAENIGKKYLKKFGGLVEKYPELLKMVLKFIGSIIF